MLKERGERGFPFPVSASSQCSLFIADRDRRTLAIKRRIGVLTLVQRTCQASTVDRVFVVRTAKGSGLRVRFKSGRKKNSHNVAWSRRHGRRGDPERIPLHAQTRVRLPAGKCLDASRGLNLDTLCVRRYLTWMKTTVSSKGQIVLPAEFRQMDCVKPGQEFDIERLDRGDYRLLRRSAPPNTGAVDWLLACPHKNFFVPIDSESTDAL